MPEKYFRKLSKENLLNNSYFLLLLIVLLGLSLRLIFFSGMGISDSLVYSRTANDIGVMEADTLSTRLGLVFATSISYKLLGINDFSAVFFVLLSSLGSIILLFYFGKLLFNEKVGLMSAFLLSFFPMDVVYSTQLLSDLPSAFFMSLGVYLFLYAEIKQKREYSLNSLLSGIFIGIGYLIRENALLIALFFVAYIIYRGRIKKGYFFVPIGVIIILIIESIIFLELTGNPIFRTAASQTFILEAMQLHNFFGRLDSPMGLLHYPWLFLTNSLLLYFYLFIFMAVTYVVLTKKKRCNILLLWFIPLILYLSFGSASFTQYAPLRAVDRYTSIITVPALLLLGMFLMEKDKLMRKVVMPASLFLLFLASLTAIYLHDNRDLLSDLRIAYAALPDQDKTIYIDGRSLLALEYISGYEDKLDLEKYPTNFNNIVDSYIVINRNMIRNLKDANPRLEFPEEIGSPPKNWMMIREIGEAEKDKIMLYYIP